MGSALGKLWQRFVDFINKLAGERSSEILLEETITSNRNQFQQSYDAIKASSGDIRILERELAQQKAAAAQAHANVKRAIQQSQNLQGVQLQAAQRQIANLQMIANTADQVVNQMEEAVRTVKITQETTEAGLAVEESNRRMREAQARSDVVLERLYGTLERASDAQLRAAGVMTTPGTKDHSQVLRDRADKARGRSEAAQRVAQQLVGSAASAEMSQAELELLSQAYAEAGMTNPSATNEVLKSQEAGTTGS